MGLLIFVSSLELYFCLLPMHWFLFYLIVFYYFPLKTYCFLRRNRKRVDPGGRGYRDEEERVEGRETDTRILCGKKSII